MSGPTLLLLGPVGGRIRIAASVTLDSAAAVPGQARLGGIGVDVDLPTSVSPVDPGTRSSVSA